jgi:hypothetical protein
MGYQFNRLDAAENAFLERSLNAIKSKAYEAKYPELKLRSLVPVAHDTPSGAETISYVEYDAVGQAKLLASYADDLPSVDVQSKEVFGKIKGLGDSYHYSRQEIRAAVQAGMPLTDRKARMARRAIEILIDEIGASGHALSGLIGLLNITNALGYTVPADGTGSSKLWSTKTPDQILRDLNGIKNYIVTQTKETERPNTIIVPPAHNEILVNTARSTTSDTTIMEFWQATNPDIAIKSWGKCTGAGVGATDRMVAYRNSEEALWLEMPLEFDQLEPEQRGLIFIVACEARTGGIICPLPFSVAYGDGI